MLFSVRLTYLTLLNRKICLLEHRRLAGRVEQAGVLRGVGIPAVKV
jgi:hypothetical protein